MNKRYILFASIFAFLYSLILFGCADEQPSWELISTHSHFETGQIVITDGDVVIDTLDTSNYFDHGHVINIATEVIKPGWTFDHWEGDLTGTDNPATLIMDGDKEVTVVYQLLEYPLSVTITGEGTVSEAIVLGKTSDYNHGTNIELSAISEIGWTFDHWEGDLTGTDNPSILTMDSDKTVTAVFRLLEYPLSVTITGEGTVSEAIVLGKTSDYNHGTNIALTATPEIGWTFDHWEGDLTGTDNPSILTMDSDKAVTAVFVNIHYTINTTTIGEGSIKKDPEQASYNYNNTVKLTAVPDEGWVFDHWEGASGNANPKYITIKSNRNITAVFVDIHYTINTTTIGEGSIKKDPEQASYNYNNTVKLTAVPDEGWVFDHWEGAVTGNANPKYITIKSNKNITAVFVGNHYTINTTTIGEGSIKKDPEQASYNYNDTVKLTAVPDDGWVFDHWEGAATGNTNPKDITIDGNKNITAVFVDNHYTINTTTIGEGSIKKDPEQVSYTYNNTVKLTAVPNVGWVFDHWEGAVTGNTNPKDITIDGNKNITAVFVDNGYTSYTTENVIIVVMDGGRYSETWGDPSHQYIPYMANYMAEHGVINTNFYNNEETITTSGHIYMTTGVYQVKEGKSKDYPYYPSIFQYWREENTSTSNKAWVIASKDKLEALGNCEIGSWKNQYLPKTDCGISGFGSGYRDDSVTYTKTINILSNYQPNLVLVNFKEPDPSGHSGIWNNYVQSIKTTDKYIYQLWNFINTNSHYKGKTTMFVTNDHGRHLDGVYGGFADHGCGCDGCRHVYFYAYGPDFKEGITINNKRELIDISATVSKLLDFSMPSGNGKVMTELFK